jgi:hypothetical protein
LYCFLHGFLKIRDRCRTSPIYDLICKQVWNVYHSKDKKNFSQRMRRLKEWATKTFEPSSTILEKINSLHGKSSLYQEAYDHPDSHRTSNMCDRLMRFMDRAIFARQGFHGKLNSATASVRSWALLKNYHPYCLRRTENKFNYTCPASELNGFKYSENWLENLVTATSMKGFRQ